MDECHLAQAIHSYEALAMTTVRPLAIVSKYRTTAMTVILQEWHGKQEHPFRQNNTSTYMPNHGTTI